MVTTVSENKLPSADSERNYFLSKIAAAATTCLGEDLDKIAESESQLKQPGAAVWLDSLNSRMSMLGLYPADKGPTHTPIILVPTPEESKIGKKGCQTPPYPRIATRKEVAGTVTVGFLVDANGMVRKARILSSSGETHLHKLLDGLAAAYIGECEFRPGTVGGVPVQSWTKIQYVWKLE
jgi:TonB family protein